MGISLVGDVFGLVDSGGSCISTVAMVRACEAIQARLVATLSIMQRTPCCGFHFLLSPSSQGWARPERKLGPRLMSLRPSQTWKMMASKPIWPATQPFTRKLWLRTGPGAIARAGPILPGRDSEDLRIGSGCRPD